MQSHHTAQSNGKTLILPKSFSLVCITTLAAIPACSQHTEEQPRSRYAEDKIEVVSDYWEGFEKKTILLDPGHGCGDKGSVRDWSKDESEVMWDLALSIEKTLEQSGHFDVLMTREAYDKGCVKYHKRGQLATSLNADILIALQADATSSVETNDDGSWLIWSPRQKSERLLRSSEWLAVSLGAGFLNDNVDLHRKRITLPRSVTSITAQEDRFMTTSPRYGVFVDRGKKGNALLRSSSKPAVLIETHFINNPKDVERFQTEEYYAKFSKSIENGLITYFAWDSGRLALQNSPNEGHWTIQIAATTDENEAEEIKSSLESKGFKSSIHKGKVERKMWYRVRTGKYKSRSQLDSAIKDLQSNGWREVWIDQES
jgi:N-acetylmuramoyl-L-alanine amidase